MNIEPLTIVIDESTREVETEIVTDTIELALAKAYGHEIGYEFDSDIVGLEYYPAEPSAFIHSTIVFNLSEQAVMNDLLVQYALGTTCHFIVTSVQST